MTVEEARLAVVQFVCDCLRQNVRCALINHGKGEGRRQPAVLKSCVAYWLPQLDDILAFHSAQQHQGGVGACWSALARPGTVTAIYMGVRAIRFVQARMLMHGADPQTPVTVVENVSRCNEKTVATKLGDMQAALFDAGITGPAIVCVGLAPRTEEKVRLRHTPLQENDLRQAGAWA